MGKAALLRFTVGGIEVALDPVVAGVGFGVTVALALLLLWVRRGLPRDPEAPPSRRAVAVAWITELFQNQVLGGVSPELAHRLFPLVAALFLYVLLCNWAGLLPFVVSPTQNVNVTLGLALLVYGLTHVYGVRAKGVRGHLKGYLEPFPFLLPLNVIGDLGRTLSHGFRLFGNILGGTLLVAVVGGLFAPLVVPAALNLWFGLFMGLIQALVFTLLAVAYIRATAE
ncbi:MAG: F0F1 ATP synthase subunit A [Candidatus Bipolaricaulota bacterium]|nr:F0F1 ATP synthase subunit A [Candidatus Bipolaricaulota bacterium]